MASELLAADYDSTEAVLPVGSRGSILTVRLAILNSEFFDFLEYIRLWL